jgi:DNA-directed RNA polymerase beta subunit
MVEEKINSRERGNVKILVRKKMEGRERDGGLSFGEMERECKIENGEEKLLRGR